VLCEQTGKGVAERDRGIQLGEGTLVLNVMLTWRGVSKRYISYVREAGEHDPEVKSGRASIAQPTKQAAILKPV
jgi:hypothetical protein